MTSVAPPPPSYGSARTPEQEMALRQPVGVDSRRVAPRDPGPLGFHRLHRARGQKVLRGLGGVGVLTIGFFLTMFGAIFPLAIYAFVAIDEPWAYLERFLVDMDESGLDFTFFVLASLGLLIPVTWVASRLCHGLGLGWLTSVAGRMRWGYFWACMGFSVIAMAAMLLVAQFVPEGLAVTGPADALQPITSEWISYALLFLLLVPFQAAAEEYVCRGYLTQIFGGLFANKYVSFAVAVLVPAYLFALAHGTQEPAVFFDRFAFGLSAGVLVIVTGGLEAVIAMHIVNNLFAFGLLLLLQPISRLWLEPTGTNWWMSVSTLTQTFVFMALAIWWARRKELETSVDGSVLVLK